MNVKNLEEEQIKPRESRRKEIAKSKKSMKEQTKKELNQKLILKKINKIRIPGMRGDITTDYKNIKWVIREYKELCK